MNPGICCELGGRDILGKILVRRGEIPRPPACCNTFETLELPKRFELRTSDPDPPPVTALRHDGDVDHPVGALIRIGVRQQAIHDTENGRRRTDAQCQGSDRSEGEPRLLAQFAPGIPKILQHTSNTRGGPKGYLYCYAGAIGSSSIHSEPRPAGSATSTVRFCSIVSRTQNSSKRPSASAKE